MTNQEQLKLALNTVYSQKSEEILNSNNIEWTYTENYDFQKKLQVLINRQKHSYWKFTNTRAKKFVIAVATLIILLSSTMTVPAVRKPVVDFIIKTYHEFSSYFISGNVPNNTPETIEKVSYPTYIPEGFYETNKIADSVSNLTIWENKNGENLTLTQNLLTVSSNINTENTTVDEIIIGEFEVTTFENNGRRLYLWNNEVYSFVLDTSSHLNISEAEKIILSIK